MTVDSFAGRAPQIGAGAWVHPSADVFGDVRIGERCWIGPGARLRATTARSCWATAAPPRTTVWFTRPGEICTIGSWVTLGHGCVVHNVTLLGDYAVVGMGAVVSDWADVGEWAVVAEGAVVTQRFVVPATRIAVGVPARLLDRPIDDEFRAAWLGFKNLYVDLCERYRTGYGR